MLPQHYEFLSSLPKTITNKVDISALTSFYNNATQPAETKLIEANSLSLREIFEKILNVSLITKQSHFFEDLGGDSLAAIEIAVQAEKFGYKFSPSLIYEFPFFGDFIDQLKSKKIDGAMSTKDLVRHLENTPLYQELQASVPCHNSHEPEHILITGSNGFLGVQLIRQLLQTTKHKLICLVRAYNHNHASERLMAAFVQQNFKLKKSDLKRLVIIAGDLSAVNFNSSATNWSFLKTNVRAIYHLAAKVNIVETFNELEAANVGTTLNILEFAIKNGVKELHYISTLSVFVSSEHNQGLIRESDDLMQAKSIYGGYAQTKWLAEYAVKQLQAKFNFVKIYRLGLITGEIESGYCPENDQLKIFVRGVKQLNCVPAAALDLEIDISPVNYVAQEIVRLAELDNTSIVCNIANRQGLKLRAVIEQLKRMDPDFKIISNQDWQRKFQSSENLSFDEALLTLSLAKIMSDSENYNARRSLDLFQATNVKFEVSDFSLIPEVSSKLLNTYIENFTADR